MKTIKQTNYKKILKAIEKSITLLKMFDIHKGIRESFKLKTEEESKIKRT